MNPTYTLSAEFPFYIFAEDYGFSIDEEDVISHITRKSRMIIVNSPNNPTGSVMSQDDWSNLARIARECDLLVISDEVCETLNRMQRAVKALRKA